MAIFKPATPGFLTTLTATILLGASYNVSGQSGLINIGTLGYCLIINGVETCTKPSIGYEFNPNTLLGDTITLLQIPTVVTKWITYALFLHVIAFGLAGISSIFGLLAHIREFSMVCFSSCISGIAASLALIAFIFDLVLFFVARTRIREISGATATIGQAIWLTLAAWILLFISGCMFGIGRCCIGNRPRNPRSSAKQDSVGGGAAGAPTVDQSYAERMRMEAIRAEADRKARQKDNHVEGGLPTFDEHETTPLSAEDELSGGTHTPYRDGSLSSSSPYNRFGAAGAATGYVPSPGPQRQDSSRSNMSQQTQGYGTGNGGGYGRGRGGYNPNMPSPGMGYPPSQPAPQNLAAVGGYAQRPLSLTEHDIYENAGLPAAGGAAGGAVTAGRTSDYLQPAGSAHGRGNSYGHHTQATSYHSAHSQQPYPSQYGDYAQNTTPSSNQYGSHVQGYSQEGYDQRQYTDQQYDGQPYDPYNTAPAQAAYSSYPPQSATPANAYAAQAAAQYSPYTSPSPQRPATMSPPRQISATPPQSMYSPPTVPGPSSDLNFPGVPAPPPGPQNIYNRSPPAVQLDPYGGYTQSSSSRAGTSNYQQQTSPSTRLAGVREQSEPSATGPSEPSHLDAPPVYDGPSPQQQGYRNEKATYRPEGSG
ncbi:hypothetical protein FRB98_002953 [Tulasnella sp. 332]|nr:hypothetical protein FRB98_002953 [Tulasnella sp. 332]